MIQPILFDKSKQYQGVDQRSLIDQLIDLKRLAVQYGMYDAADYVERELTRHYNNKRQSNQL